LLLNLTPNTDIYPHSLHDALPIFGIEIEFTGITRSEAARVTAEYFGGTITSVGDYYDTKKVIAPDGRVWKLMSDGSISCQKRNGDRKSTRLNSSHVKMSYAVFCLK